MNADAEEIKAKTKIHNCIIKNKKYLHFFFYLTEFKF